MSTAEVQQALGSTPWRFCMGLGFFEDFPDSHLRLCFLRSSGKLLYANVLLIEKRTDGKRQIERHIESTEIPLRPRQ
jgi:hypothetical protein